MRFAAFLFLAGTAWGSITNECTFYHGDGSTEPCETSEVTYGSMTWGATFRDPWEPAGAVANLAFTQQLTFSGPTAGTQGYLGIFAYDLTVWNEPGNGSYQDQAKSNLGLYKTFDDSGCAECYAEWIEPLNPITFGTPITFTVTMQSGGSGGYGSVSGVAGWFRVLQFYVFDSNKHLLITVPSPTTEFAEVQVPVNTPEPATMGLTAAAILAFRLGCWSRRKTNLD